MSTGAVRTDIPARLDRLPWRRLHVLIVTALGITWILDGLEVTFIGAIAGVLQGPAGLGLTAAELGGAASSYLAGAVAGALWFGWLTDRAGRRLVFNLTLLVYLAGVALTAASWNFWSLAAGRALTGIAIGGEYSAINSAIDELIPARLRGRVDLMVNGSYWLGAAAGAGLSLVLAGPGAAGWGWRAGFALGGVLALGILALRRFVPESPRWLVTHGRLDEAEQVMRGMEAMCGPGLAAPDWTLEITPRASFGLRRVMGAMWEQYRPRAVLVLVLMAAQALLFNAIFFTYGLVLIRFDHVPAGHVGWFILPLAAANFLGPVVLGGLFDSVGRRRMLAVTYGASGVLLAGTAVAFSAGLLDARSQTMCWGAVFFFASAAASAAYLTASEVFPLEVRGLAIAVFYAAGTAVGGVLAPFVFSLLVAGGRTALAWGYGGAGLAMAAAALVAAAMGVDAEGASLERVSAPLSQAGPRCSPS